MDESAYHDYEDDYPQTYDVDIPEEYDQAYDYDEEVPFREDVTISEVYETCVKSSLINASEQLILLFISCLIFKILTQLLPLRRDPWCHIISGICGVFGLYALIGPTIFYTCVLALCTYWAVLFCFLKPFKEHSYKFVMFVFFAYLVIREYFEIIPEQWETVRGVQMIIVLKSLSVSYEITTQARKAVPPFLDYVGYMFCPGTVAFGPWIPMNIYYQVYQRRPWAFTWVVKVFAATTFSFMCLGISSCWIIWLFLGINSSWLLAVRDAISVRFSHYFVSYMSEAMCVLCGFYGGNSDPQMNIEVTNPLKIELPRSLGEVVVNWNIPMHKWLKIHVFRASQNIGILWKVVLTFLVSSLLHGLNFSLSMVLLSLGFYTFVEHRLREKLSSIFNACIESRKCSSSSSSSNECQRHKYKSSHPGVFLTNLMFSGLAYFHLAYLGVMMSKKPDEQISSIFTDGLAQQLQSWSRLDYLSHWIVLGSYLFSIWI